MLSDVGEWGVASVLQVFFITENWICIMTRHHAESNINILLTRNLPFDSDVRQWSHFLMISLHCLWAKANNKMRGQCECDMTWFCFYFEFVRSHARCGCCSIFCQRGGGEVRLKLDVQDQGEGLEYFWTYMGKGGGGL